MALVVVSSIKSTNGSASESSRQRGSRRPPHWQSHPRDVRLSLVVCMARLCHVVDSSIPRDRLEVVQISKGDVAVDCLHEEGKKESKS
jgi:hypothetical protein